MSAQWYPLDWRLRKGAQLSATKQRQLVRIVNTSPAEVKFAVGFFSNPTGRSVSVSPASGTIGPRGWRNILIENPHWEGPGSEAKLEFVYWMGKSLVDGPRRGAVPISLVPEKGEAPVESEPTIARGWRRQLKGRTVVWWLVRLFRVTLLTALIAYNVALIGRRGSL